jgi:selenocysteine lyase/cysteine desulfurase
MLTRDEPSAPPIDISALRAREFGRLTETGEAYLDYAGAALYGSSQLRDYQALLVSGVFGNPHSEHRPSRESTNAIEAARERVLRFFNVTAATHAVCFTANCTAAIKLIAESYPFSERCGLLLSADNHNSVNGVREYARRASAAVSYLPIGADLRLQDPADALARVAGVGPGLLAFPAQSNFSGVRHSLTLVGEARALGLHVLLDAAALVAAAPLDLSAVAADFTVLSFYKLFGFPTGVGALVVRRDALAALRRPWFAGGTVTYASVQHDRHRLRDLHEGFEDGTPNFLGIAALAPGHDLIDRVTLPRIASHTAVLTARAIAGLSDLRHGNGEPVVRIYGPRDRRECGSTIALNALTDDGVVVPYGVVESRAREARVAVRGGCFCNPGAAEAAFAFDAARSAACFDALGERFSVERFASCLESADGVGAIRVSIGLANNASDIDRLIALIATFRR